MMPISPDVHVQFIMGGGVLMIFNRSPFCSDQLLKGTFCKRTAKCNKDHHHKVAAFLPESYWAVGNSTVRASDRPCKHSGNSARITPVNSVCGTMAKTAL